MRTFSALREKCSYPELIDLAVPMSKSRQAACDVGTEFHAAVESWVKGTPMPALTSKDARTWLAKMEKVWTPPPGCEAEIAIGLTDDHRAVTVDEPEPHVYVPRDPGTRLVTAGRLDLRWPEGTARAVVDVKTGRMYLGDPWTIPQLVAQAVTQALAEHDGEGAGATSIKLGVYYARLGMFDWGEERDINDVINTELPAVRRWATQDPSPNPGAWCLSCYSRANCDKDPARGEAA